MTWQQFGQLLAANPPAEATIRVRIWSTPSLPTVSAIASAVGLAIRATRSHGRRRRGGSSVNRSSGSRAP
jgi:hypothetical protein